MMSDRNGPESEQALAAFLAECHAKAESVCITGGETRLEAGTIQASRPLSTTGLTGIVDYHPGEMTLIVRSGTALMALEPVLTAEGQALAFEPMAGNGIGISTIGGVVATNASGPRRIAAGACRDHLLGVRFVDGRGRIIKSGGRVMKNVTGLDISKLLCGSYGTLGVLTEVALKTLPVAPCQETIVLHAVNAREAVDIFTKALATPYAVSGAAFHANTAWLRIEGLESQVAYRHDRIQALFRDLSMSVLDDSESRALWRGLRDVEHFSASSEPLWRVLVKPTDAPATVTALENLGGQTALDWGGGLIWYCGHADAGQVRAALTGGHATLLRSGGLAASDRFQPEATPVAALSAALRRTFDPARILNPGLMGA